MNKKTHLSIRMDEELHDKFQVVAAYEDRSMSSKILQLIRQCVRDFEEQHGPISRDDME